MALGFSYDYDRDGALSVESKKDPWDVFLGLVKRYSLNDVIDFLSSHSYSEQLLAARDNTPMRLAAQHGKVDTLEYLLKNRFVKDKVAIHDNIALKETVKNSQWECAAILCHHGAKISVLAGANQDSVQLAYLKKYGVECDSSWSNKVCNYVAALIFDGPSGSQVSRKSIAHNPADYSKRKIKSSF